MSDNTVSRVGFASTPQRIDKLGASEKNTPSSSTTTVNISDAAKEALKTADKNVEAVREKQKNSDKAIEEYRQFQNASNKSK